MSTSLSDAILNSYDRRISGRVIIDGHTISGVTTSAVDTDPSSEPHWLSLDVTFSVRNPVPQASVTFNRMPRWVKHHSSVQIYLGYDGFEVMVFNGRVETRRWRIHRPEIVCAGQSSRLFDVYEVTNRDVNGANIPSLVGSLLSLAGVPSYSVNIVNRSLCTKESMGLSGEDEGLTLSYNTLGKAITDLVDPDGGVIFEHPNGQVFVETERLLPAASPWRIYSTTGSNPRILALEISDEEAEDNIRTKVVVRGATIKVDDGQGGKTNETIETVSVVAGSSIDGPFNETVYSNPLICSLQWASEVGERLVAKLSGTVETGVLRILGDPQIALLSTIQIDDPVWTYHDGVRYLVDGYRHRVTEGSFITEVEIRGGVLGGGSGITLPKCSFIYKQRQIGDPQILIEFTFTGVDPDGTLTSENILWSDDQGNTGVGEKVLFSYSPGITISMTVVAVDSDGGQCSHTEIINVIPQSHSRDDVDVSTRDLLAAISNHATFSVDGGESWIDKTKAQLGISGDVISCSADVAKGFLNTDRGQFSTAYFWGTSAGEIARTLDAQSFSVVFIHPSGSACNHIHVPIDFPNYVYAVFENGDLYGSFALGEPNTWGLISSLGYPLKRVKAQPGTFGVRVRVCGGRGDQPSTFLQENNFPGTHLFESLQGLSWITLTSAIPGGSQDQYCADFDSPASDWDDIVISVNGRSDGIYRSTDGGSTWTQAVLDGSSDWISIGSGGTPVPTKVAFRSGSRSVWRSLDGVLWTEFPLALPSNGRHLINDFNWLPLGEGMIWVWWGAVEGGIVKSFNDGESWDYIRPFGSATWPAGADGKQVALGSKVIVIERLKFRPTFTAFKSNTNTDSVVVDQLNTGKWREVSNVIDTGDNTNSGMVDQMERNPVSGTWFRVFYKYVVGGSPTATLQRSVDDRVTWSDTTVTNCRSFCFDSTGDILAVANVGGQDSTVDSTIHKSSDDGVTFTVIATLPITP